MKLLVIEHCPIIEALIIEGEQKAAFECWRETGERHTMVPGRTGQAGLILARETKYDLIIMETDLPDISGFDLAAQIKKEGKNRDTPIIGFVDEHTKKTKGKAAEVGIAGILPRPIKTCYLQSICGFFRNKICEMPCIKEEQGS